LPTKAGWKFRPLLRDLFVVVAIVLTAPLWLPVQVQRLLSGGDSFFAGCSEALSLIPGRVGLFLRRGFYRLTLDACATDCHIGFGTTLAHPQVRISQGVYIGNRCTLGQVDVGNHATIGSNVDILSGRHQHHFDQLDEPIQAQGGVFNQVRIGRNCWVGNSAVIMADIGADCVIGAGSVVVRPIPAGVVAVGNPAVVKKRRVAA
jgi:acetyltransferase-like isoleucine patch superfamily enzyme